ncbi:MAG: PilN domain-containing protein [Halobacteriovoraceae bacterium]|nr:PilN domain-containing protein [Halobacteriovoraceae bacterium]
MIKINLIEKKKPFRIPVVIGIDLNKVNIFGWIMVAILWQLPEYVLPDYFKEELAAKDQELIVKKKEVNNLKKDTEGNEILKRELQAYEEKFKEVNILEKNVQKIIDTKTSPLQILLHIAKQIPEDMWFDSIVIKDRKIKINGRSTNFTSLGNFVGNANNSIFFNKSLNLISSDSKEEDINGDGVPERYEVFVIEGTIDRFE